MSRYICFSPNGQFDVRFEELVSKAKNPGGFLRKNVFRVHFGLFAIFVLLRGHFCTNLHESLATELKLILLATLFYKKKSF